METLDLDHAVLCGWSYGPLVFLDYIRHYGEDRIGGLHFMGAVTKLGSEDAMSVLTPELLGIFGDFLSSDAVASIRGSKGLLRLCYPKELAASEQSLMLEYNLSVPPYVRQGLFSRSLSNDDLLPKIRKPVLITHGVADAIVKPAAVEKHKSLMPHAQVHMMAHVGHAAFWDDATAFNKRLHVFGQGLLNRATQRAVEDPRLDPLAALGERTNASAPRHNIRFFGPRYRCWTSTRACPYAETTCSEQPNSA